MFKRLKERLWNKLEKIAEKMFNDKNEWGVKILFGIFVFIISSPMVAYFILSTLCMISYFGQVEIGAITPDLDWVRIIATLGLINKLGGN